MNGDEVVGAAGLEANNGANADPKALLLVKSQGKVTTWRCNLLAAACKLGQSFRQQQKFSTIF